MPLPPSFAIYLVVSKLLSPAAGNPKIVGIDLWDIEEKPTCSCPCDKTVIMEKSNERACTGSPCAIPEKERWVINVKCPLNSCYYLIPYESTIFNIDDVKQNILNQVNWTVNNLLIEVFSPDENTKVFSPYPQNVSDAIGKMESECKAEVEEKSMLFVDGMPYGKFALWPYIDPSLKVPPVSSNYNDPQTSPLGTPGNPPIYYALLGLYF